MHQPDDDHSFLKLKAEIWVGNITPIDMVLAILFFDSLIGKVYHYILQFFYIHRYFPSIGTKIDAITCFTVRIIKLQCAVLFMFYSVLGVGGFKTDICQKSISIASINTKAKPISKWHSWEFSATMHPTFVWVFRAVPSF